MGVREETLQALLEGQTPGQISQQRGVSLPTTLAYLNQMVGEGKLRRSDILFSISAPIRQAINDAKGSCPDGVDLADYRVVKLYGDAGHALGDMYDDIREVETTLHAYIRLHLQIDLGAQEAGWWRSGIPEAIRKSCQTRREEDGDPAADAYCYTDLLDLGRIIEHNWPTFKVFMPDSYQNNRKQLLDDFRRLNTIRRKVMHPVRGDVPTESDFDSVRSFKRAIMDTVTAAIAKFQANGPDVV